MHHKPRGFLSDAQITRHFVRANAILAVHQEPKRDKPLVERNCGILKNGSDLHRELLRTLLALPALLRRQIIMLTVSTLRAHRTVRPPESGYRVNADLLIAKVLHGLLEC